MTNDKPAMRYRTIDIVTPVMIAVAFGVIFLGYGALYSLLKPVSSVYVPGTIISGVIQALPMELCLLIVAYRKAGPKLAMVAGALTGIAEGIYERISYYPMFRFGDTVVYLILMVVSGALLGGLLAWGIVRGLAAAGALNPFAVSRELRGGKRSTASARNLS